MSDDIERAVELFRQGHNCAQAILITYGERFGLDRETALRLTVGLEGGLGLTGEVCGAVNGACLVLGLEAGEQEDSSTDEGRKLGRKRVREFTRRFRRRYGNVACRELLGSDIGTRTGMMVARGKRAFSKQCPEYVAGAAEILEEMLDGDGTAKENNKDNG